MPPPRGIINVMSYAVSIRTPDHCVIDSIWHWPRTQIRRTLTSDPVNAMRTEESLKCDTYRKKHADDESEDDERVVVWCESVCHTNHHHRQVTNQNDRLTTELIGQNGRDYPAEHESDDKYCLWKVLEIWIITDQVPLSTQHHARRQQYASKHILFTAVNHSYSPNFFLKSLRQFSVNTTHIYCSSLLHFAISNLKDIHKSFPFYHFHQAMFDMKIQDCGRTEANNCHCMEKPIATFHWQLYQWMASTSWMCCQEWRWAYRTLQFRWVGLVGLQVFILWLSTELQ